MTFDKLKFIPDCNCLDNAVLDTESHFGRVANSENLKSKHFRSQYEKSGKDVEGNCKRKCSHRGISMSKINKDNITKVISIYKELFPIAPRYRPYIHIVSFTEKAGLLKRTPSKNNKHHWDLFKSDTFTLQEVIKIESISLVDV